MSAHAAVEKELVLADGPRERHWRGTLQGRTVTQVSWVEGGRPKENVTTLSDEQRGITAFWKIVRKKMRAGYAFRRDAAGAKRGELLLETFAPAAAFDLSPDGQIVATAALGTGARGCKIVLVDVRTGARRVVHEEPAGQRQTFLHAALFDRTGEGLYFQLNEDAWRLDLTTAARTKVAGYLEFRTAQFNPFVVRPSFDAARRRLIVFDEGSVVRVLNEGGQPALEVSTASQTTECRAAGISPSGRLLAIYRVSRGLVYGHEDAKHDRTNEVEVWDINRRKLRTRLPFPNKLDRVGIDPQDKHLIVTWEYAQGPVAYALSSGAESWRFKGVMPRHRLATCHGWAFSPDGSLLAVAGDGLQLYRGATRKRIPLPEPGGYRVDRVAFSSDGHLLASVSGGTASVRQV